MHLKKWEAAPEKELDTQPPPSSEPPVPESAAETWSSLRATSKRAAGGFMDPDIFKAQLDALLQKEKKTKVNVELAAPRAEIMYPEGYEAQIQAMLQEVVRQKGDQKGFMDSVRNLFQTQREALLGKEYGELVKRTPSVAAAEFANSLRTEIEEMARQRVMLGEEQRRKPTWEESDQIYVMGCDLVGRYIAFLLAGTESIPPVRYLIHRMNIWHAWKNCGRQLQLQRITGVETRNRAKAEFMSMTASPPLPGPLIPNLIVTVPPGSVVGALRPIKHRLDHRSTICLIHHGLGAMEAIIEAHFPDEHTRPAFLLGHMTAKVRQFKGHFSATEVEDGRLYLTIPTTKGGHLIKKYPPPERTVRFTSLLALLMTIPELNASSHPFPDFLKRKLPSLALLSIAEPLAAICGVPYEELMRHDTTKHLMAAMLSEVCAVVSKMPECRREGSSLSFLSVFLQKKFYTELQNQKKSQPRLDLSIYRAWETDINYLTGYFIHRASELNIRVPILTAVLKLLKAKRHFATEGLENSIPFEGETAQLVDDLGPGQQS